MKLNKHFLTHTMDGQTVLIPTAEADFHGLVQCNKSVAVILDCLKKEWGFSEEDTIVREAEQEIDRLTKMIK